MLTPQIYLASSSPRRRELLEQISVRYALIDIDVPEQQHAAEAPEMYVLRLALEKARAGRRMSENRICLPVLGADTAVVIGDAMLGKPVAQREGIAMLEKLSGRTHHIYSAVALVSDSEETRLSVSAVTFRKITNAERMAYAASGEGADKAGGYAIQGRAAAFVSRLEGSYSGVMGLPLFETAELLMAAGIHIFGNPE